MACSLQASEGQASQGATLDSLEPDAFSQVCAHLRHRDLAALAATSAATRHAVGTADRLWAALFRDQFPQTWQHLTHRRQGHGGGVLPGGWREAFLQTHTTCQQLRSTAPACREWTTDAAAVTLAAIHGSGSARLTLAVQGATVELRCAPPAGAKSFQLYGHSARVSCAAVLAAGGAGSCRAGVVTGSHDQTLRLWSALVDPDSYEFRSQPLSLLTPLRTLRGHQESLTSLQLVTGSSGVVIAATGGKDRTVRLWGLAPLVPSPVQKPQIATLRGHGAPVTCLAMAGGSSCWGSSWDGNSQGSAGGWNGSSSSSAGSGSGTAGGGWLLSGSLDSRVKSWDPWTAACTGTVRCDAPVTAMQPVAECPELQPHSLLVAGGGALQLLDLRCMRAVATAAALPAERVEPVLCLSQHNWDVAIGGSDGARVLDLRMLSSSPLAASSSSSAAASSSSCFGVGKGPAERLRLGGHARPVTSIHVDRHKVVTATSRCGQAPVRVWCPHNGECLAELDSSCLPATSSGGVVQAAAAAAAAAGEAAEGSPEQLQQGGEAEKPQSVTSSSGPHHEYHRGWEGVTALACRGALLVTGSSEGAVCERDYRGGLPEKEQEGVGLLAGKFWQYGLDDQLS